MSNFNSRLAWFAATIFLYAGTWLFAGFGSKPHLSDLTCSNCHLAGKEVAPGKAGRLIGSQELLCGICHKNVKRMSHPTGFAPKEKLPAEFPLDWKGDMTCSTCHEVHGTMPGLMRSAKRSREFCLSCHDKQFFSGMKDRGASLPQSGHALPNVTPGSLGGGIDSLSLHCMGCHIAQNDAVGVRVDAKGIVRHRSGGANHPIGIFYPAAFGNSGFRPKEALPKAIWLPDGKLSCVSCHQPYKKIHGQLVMSNAGSTLCTQCHDL
ncbi:MAG: cytochrome c3 family protein [Sulfuritalea sp.]|nr:cytochrome c3 family protein [Sulfuritalea sp.]